jgi:hypothetical protein
MLQALLLRAAEIGGNFGKRNISLSLHSFLRSAPQILTHRVSLERLRRRNRQHFLRGSTKGPVNFT